MDRDTEIETLAKSALISFVDDDPAASPALIRDLECAYKASPIVYLFQNVSAEFFKIFLGIVSAYLFHLIFGKRHARRSRKELEDGIRRIIKDSTDQLRTQIERLEKQAEKLSLQAKEAKRLRVYRIKADLLVDTPGSIPYLMDLLDTEIRRGPDGHEEHVLHQRRRRAPGDKKGGRRER